MNNKCKSITKKNTPCKNSRWQKSDYCYIHSFGKFNGVPWYLNSLTHFIVVVILPVTLFLFGPSRSIQEKMLKNDTETHTKLDRIIDENNETPILPSITLKSASLVHKEKLNNGQYNFDIKFKIVNSGNQDIVILAYTIFSTDGKEVVNDFPQETEEILPPYATSERMEIADLTNCSSDYLLKFPYFILHLKYKSNINNKEYEKLFFRKVFYEKEKNLISSNLSHLSKQELKDIKTLLTDKLNIQITK